MRQAVSTMKIPNLLACSAIASVLLCASPTFANTPDRWASDAPALIEAKIRTCMSLHSSSCGRESYFDCANEHGTQSEIDQGFCVRTAYEVWLRLIDRELSRPGRGQAWALEAKEAQTAWLAWSDHACRMQTSESEGGTSRSRILVSCNIANAENWLRQIQK